jgi:hypothetical protein
VRDDLAVDEVGGHALCRDVFLDSSRFTARSQN